MRPRSLSIGHISSRRGNSVSDDGGSWRLVRPSRPICPIPDCATALSIMLTLIADIRMAVRHRMSKCPKLFVIRSSTRSDCGKAPQSLIATGAHVASSLTAAAKAAGPAVSQIFLTVRTCGGRNGCDRDKGQREGQNELSHDNLLWLVRCVSGTGWPTACGVGASASLADMDRFAVPSDCRALARDRMSSRKSDGKPEADLHPVLHFFADFQIPSICSPRTGNEGAHFEMISSKAARFICVSLRT